MRNPDFAWIIKMPAWRSDLNVSPFARLDVQIMLSSPELAGHLVGTSEHKPGQSQEMTIDVIQQPGGRFDIMTRIGSTVQSWQGLHAIGWRLCGGRQRPLGPLP
ncbi:hypothetical protein I546_6391 [Mycobacterium kansasii 732]|uniref:Uncharacterized protein n=1 Tax=Mycobacterium kansasii TaxID=1768 RepID=A0A164E6R5_MYCKA|nr:hypothetical protein I546_6391 [Mycobacterium kansasii 732]KZS67091.1 hypothetical protein A4G27_10540 [Mycobacterium kansasii]OOK70471.1 hypothetical protein BZL30_6667 [Mycobacterium kansasii]